ncbi:tRNA (guanosine(46)-N7)-methyltransferase TrmB [Actinotalea fermentans]|nr:tRNA (guanosine(46)-N7)-methyltransferase TrmB [Actinotalea fermentans]
MWPGYGFEVDDPAAPPPLTPGGELDRERLFGRRAPLVVEIGSGMGEAVRAMAAADAGRDYLACEAHVPGVANLVADLADGGPANVRVAAGDALELLRRWVPPASLDAVHAFFPDPWPKARHHKRRLLRPDRLAFLASRLAVGGTLHVATDWAPYAEEILAAVLAEPRLHATHEGFAPRPAHRPVTRFEERAAAAGRPAFDVVAVRR